MNTTLTNIKLVVAATVLVAVAGLIFLWGFALNTGLAALKAGDNARALTYLRPLAHLSNNTAQYFVGYVLACGQGVSEDDEQAIRWFQRSGSKSDPSIRPEAAAEMFVAKRYSEGACGTTQERKALTAKWLRLAADAGDKEAQAEWSRVRHK